MDRWESISFGEEKFGGFGLCFGIGWRRTSHRLIISRCFAIDWLSLYLPAVFPWTNQGMTNVFSTRLRTSSCLGRIGINRKVNGRYNIYIVISNENNLPKCIEVVGRFSILWAIVSLEYLVKFCYCLHCNYMHMRILLTQVFDNCIYSSA